MFETTLIPGDPVADFVVKRVLLFEVGFVSLLSLVLGPMVAAYRVRKDAKRVFHETLRGELQEMLDAEREATLKEVRAIFSEEREQMRAEVAQAQQQLEARAAEIRGQAEALQAAGSKAFAHGAVDPSDARAARTAKEAQRAVGEAQVVGGLAEQMGPDVAAAVVEYARNVVPKSWQLAVTNPEEAPGILGPLAKAAKSWMAGKGQGGAPARREAGGALPY